MEVKNKKTKKKERWVLVLAVILSLFTLNFLASRHFTRLDLTKQKVYTLSPATKKILKNLEDTVTMRLYFSTTLPVALMALRKDVEDILAEFKTHSKSKIQVEFHHPQENAVEEQKVQMMGIPPVEVNVIEKDKQEVAKIYLGMTIHSEAKQEVLPVVQNIRNLEYRLSDAILKVTQTKRPVLGMWDLEENSKNYSLLLQRLRERFEIKTFTESNLGELQAEEVPTLLVIAPSPLPNQAIQGIEKYLGQGGKVLLFLDSMGVNFEQALNASKNENPFEKILENYGVSITSNLVLDRSNAMATFSGGMVSYHIPYPYWVRIHPDNFNKEEPFVSELQSLVLPWVTAIEMKNPPPEGVKTSTLFQSTPYAVSQTYQEGLASLEPNTAKKIFEENQPHTYPLGVLTSKIMDGKESKIILVGNTQFLRNNFLEQFEENLVFFENALDTFLSNEALIGIRSKGVENYPIAVVSDFGRQIIKAVVILASPLLLCLLGLGVIFWQRAKAKALRLVFGSSS